MKKVFLLSPYCEDTYKMDNHSLNYIRYFLIDNGYSCEAVDLSDYDHDYKFVESLLFPHRDDKIVIGVTGYTRERFHAYRLIKKVREVCPNACIVVGGHHFGYLAKETMLNLEEVDIVVRGEGEITFKKLCDAVKNGDSFSSIEGITYRNKNLIDEKTGNPSIIENKNAGLERNLDKFRTWDYQEFKDNYKHQLQPSKLDPGNKYITVMATRGCPSNCNFCSLTTDIVRFRSIGNIVDEIEEKINISNCKNISFADSSLTVNKNYVRSLCDEIINRKLNIQWNCYSRIDMDHDLLAYMKKSGCVSVEIALESGSPRILKAIGKGTSLEKYMDFVKLAYDLGIKAWCFLIVSSTDEEYKDAEMTLDLLEKSSKYVYDFGLQVTRILPDTQLDSIARERGVIPKDFDWFAPYECHHEKLFKTDSYKTLPIYVEKMTNDEISRILERFEAIKERHFVYTDGLRKIILGNFQFHRLKKYHFTDYVRKVRRLFVMLKNINKSSNKVKHFENIEVDTNILKRPDSNTYTNDRVFNKDAIYRSKKGNLV